MEVSQQYHARSGGRLEVGQHLLEDLFEGFGLAVAAAERLAGEGIDARVVSMPCTSLFECQDAEYRDAVLPPAATARVVVEAGATAGWWRYAGSSGKVIGITGSVGKTSTKELTYSVLSQRFQTLKSPGNRNSILGLPPVLLQLQPTHEMAVLEMGMD